MPLDRADWKVSPNLPLSRAPDAISKIRVSDIPSVAGVQRHVCETFQSRRRKPAGRESLTIQVVRDESGKVTESSSHYFKSRFIVLHKSPVTHTTRRRRRRPYFTSRSRARVSRHAEH